MSTSSTTARQGAVTEDQVLDATRRCLLAVGVRRTTLADVARRLGVSRPTIYRRWPDIGSLVAAALTREWTEVVRTNAPRAADRASIVDSMVAATRAMRDHPLLRKVIEVDPEWLLPYVLDRRGASQDAVLGATEAAIVAGQRTAEVRAGDPAALARAVVLVVQSFVLSAATMADTVGVDALDTELHAVLDRYLAPSVEQ